MPLPGGGDFIISCDKKNNKIKNTTIINAQVFSHPIFLIIMGVIYLVCLILNFINTEFFFNTFFSDYICLNVSPLVVYINADKEKAIAIKSNRKKSGIYRWTHKESGKSYIGSAVDLGQRFSSYFSYPIISRQAKNSIIITRVVSPLLVAIY